MNAKIVKTKQALLDALTRLLSHFRLDEISVSQLCKEAGINRTTFYKYYAIPMDVLTENVDEILNEILYRKDIPQRELPDYMTLICQTIYRNRELMSVYMRSGGDLMHLFHKSILRHTGHLGFFLEPGLNFVAGGTLSLLMTWMVCDYLQTPEEMAQILTRCALPLLQQEALPPLYK